MIKGLPNINIYIMNDEKEDSDEKGLLSKMLKKKEKKDSMMLKEMEAMRKVSEDIKIKTGGTSHVGGG